MKKVMIVSGEASGDIHGSNLVKSMLARDPALSFYGMGGKASAEAGVNILFEAHKVSVVGIAEILTHLPDILSAQKVLKQFLKEERPHLLIIIDFPDFNLMLASYAKQLDIPVFYYITPQVWAWRSGRVKKIKKLVDQLGVILPFEEQFFKERGADAKYVGHPLLDSVAPQYGRNEFFRSHDIENDNLLIGLIPGSRNKEIRNLLPTFFEAARKLAHQLSRKITFLLPQASTISLEQLEECGLKEFIDDGFHLIRVTEDQHEAMASCDVVMAASGTVTLELALLDVPMVVVYKTSPSTYFLGKHVIRIKIENFSLVNLIADDPFILELLQHEVTAENISAELYSIVTDQTKEKRIRNGLQQVREKLGGPGASDKAAQLAFKVMEQYG